MSNTHIAIKEIQYAEILRKGVEEIHTTRHTIALQVNCNSNAVYWNLGKLLSEKHIQGGYGSGVVNKLSVDLKTEFPNMGLSPRNLWNMKRFYERYYLADSKLLQAVAVLKWGHNLLLLDKIQNLNEAEFYATESIAKGWSRDLLLNAIKMDTFRHANNTIKTHNFDQTLAEIDANYANEVFKSSYNLAFSGTKELVRELEFQFKN